MFQGFKVSMFQSFNVSKFQCFKVEKFQSFNVSMFQSFNVSEFQSFRVSKFQCFRVSGLKQRSVKQHQRCVKLFNIAKGDYNSCPRTKWNCEPPYWREPLIGSKPHPQSIPIKPNIGKKSRTPTPAERLRLNGL